MTQEEKQLLLKDLCARLSCGVKVSITAHDLDYEKDFGKTIIAELTGICTAKDDDDTTYTCFITCYDKFKTQGNDIDTIKPYLRPMSSMTKSERFQFFLASKYASLNDDNTLNHCSPDGFDWLNSHHFDYRGLIPMGLALEAKEGMYECIKTE